MSIYADCQRNFLRTVTTTVMLLTPVKDIRGLRSGTGTPSGSVSLEGVTAEWPVPILSPWITAVPPAGVGHRESGLASRQPRGSLLSVPLRSGAGG